ncbi:MAG: hypothetical protein O3B24_03110 [Verrucomicrobia bacterium]|nr:hypothetical protein [Verrucomicrobiota bacterium]
MKHILLPCVALLVLGAVVLQTGCETQSSEDNGVRVEPHAIGLQVNQSQEFTASGGFNYTWKLSDASLGTLTRKDGPITTYISRFDASSNSTAVVQHLTVTSTLGSGRTTTDGSNTTTSSSGFVDTAEAVIEHLRKSGSTGGGGSSTGGGSTLTISPNGDTLNQSDTVQTFVASGGSGTYTSWLLTGDTGLGGIFPASGASTTYTYTSTNVSGSVVLNLVDSESNVKAVTIFLTGLP